MRLLTENITVRAASRFLLVALLILFCFEPSLISQTTVAKKNEQQIVLTEESAPDRMGISVLPIVYYTPETRMAFGLGSLFTYRFGLLFKEARPSTLFLGAIYTQEKQFIFQIKPEIYLQNNSFFLAGNFLAERFPTNFWGIGPDTEDSLEESYTPQRYLAELGIQRKLAHNFPLYIGLRYRLEKTSILKTEPGKLLDQGLVPGSQGGVLSGPAFILSFDQRDNIFYPASGLYLQANIAWNDHLFGSDFDFINFKLDLRNYYEVASEQILTVQALLESNSGDVPFYRLAQLGGDSLLRGFYSGRYREKNLAAFQAEYRFPVWKRLSAVVFGAMGSLAGRLKDISFDNLKYAAGFGLRFKVIPREKANLRVDFAFGPGTYGIYFKAGEAF